MKKLLSVMALMGAVSTASLHAAPRPIKLMNCAVDGVFGVEVWIGRWTMMPTPLEIDKDSRYISLRDEDRDYTITVEPGESLFIKYWAATRLGYNAFIPIPNGINTIKFLEGMWRGESPVRTLLVVSERGCIEGVEVTRMHSPISPLWRGLSGLQGLPLPSTE